MTHVTCPKQDVIHSALTFRANNDILEQLKENLKVAAKSGDHVLWKVGRCVKS